MLILFIISKYNKQKVFKKLNNVKYYKQLKFYYVYIIQYNSLIELYLI